MNWGCRHTQAPGRLNRTGCPSVCTPMQLRSVVDTATIYRALLIIRSELCCSGYADPGDGQRPLCGMQRDISVAGTNEIRRTGIDDWPGISEMVVAGLHGCVA